MAGMLWLQAQTEAGNVLIGTSTSLYGSSSISLLEDCPNTVGFTLISHKVKADDYESDATQVTAFNFSPRVGIFTADNFLLGAELFFGSYKEEDMKEAYTDFVGGPFMRYYFELPNFKPFLQAGLTAGQMKISDNMKFNSVNFGVGVGGAFFVNEKVSIDLIGNFVHSTVKSSDTSDNSRQLLNAFSFGVGLSVFL